jgi:hypothetical protein
MTDVSSIREFRAEINMPVPMSDLLHALDAVNEHPEWMAGVRSAKKVTMPDMDTLLHYVIDIPMPFSDRDMVLTRDKMFMDHGDAYLISLKGVAQALPEEDGLVRMPYVNGSWHFRKISEQQTAVTYQFVSDPGGKLPDWVVNSFIVSNTYKTLRDLLARLEDEE